MLHILAVAMTLHSDDQNLGSWQPILINNCSSPHWLIISPSLLFDHPRHCKAYLMLYKVSPKPGKIVDALQRSSKVQQLPWLGTFIRRWWCWDCWEKARVDGGCRVQSGQKSGNRKIGRGGGMKWNPAWQNMGWFGLWLTTATETIGTIVSKWYSYMMLCLKTDLLMEILVLVRVIKQGLPICVVKGRPLALWAIPIFNAPCETC